MSGGIGEFGLLVKAADDWVAIHFHAPGYERLRVEGLVAVRFQPRGEAKATAKGRRLLGLDCNLRAV